MKKLFALHAAGKIDARVLETIKNEVRKYVKRERRKSMPAGYDTWDFACKVGPDAGLAKGAALPEIGKSIDDVAAIGGNTVYIEILAQASLRPPTRGRSTPAGVGAIPALPPDHAIVGRPLAAD
jgi:hypothetical protein